ncbi:MAG: GGDEF domain-containing protein [Anaerolineae bacterium]|nr:GGDEF domain-containing protein [Anaerolineae bacterium]
MSIWRWVLIAGGTLYLVLSGKTTNWILGAGTLGIGLLLNGLFTFLLRQGSFTPIWSVVAQAADTILFTLYTAALQSGIKSYLPIYTTMVVTATIRFGLIGAVSSGLAGVLLNAVTAQQDSSPSAAVILTTILADSALLAYLAYLVRQQQMANQENTERLHDEIDRIIVLHEASNIVHDLKSEDALQNIVEIPTKIMRFQRAALFLTKDVGDMLPREYYSRSSEAQSERLPDISLAPGLFASLIEQKTPIVIDGSQGAPDMAYGPILQVAVPLQGQQYPVGVLVADRNDQGAVSQADKEMLFNLAKSAVMAIENVTLHRQVRRMANHDGVTDLFNHRYFQEAMRDAISESRGKWHISLLMVEIDKFKKYNDTFGHRQGDTALKSLARSLETLAQSHSGLVARYGGDEFVVILPRADQQKGARLASEIRIRACQLAEEMLRQHDLPTISLSVGVATYPDDAKTAAELIEAADQAMYVVKHSGGNQSHAYSQDLLMRRTS